MAPQCHFVVVESEYWQQCYCSLWQHVWLLQTLCQLSSWPPPSWPTEQSPYAPPFEQQLQTSNANLGPSTDAQAVTPPAAQVPETGPAPYDTDDTLGSGTASTLLTSQLKAPIDLEQAFDDELLEHGLTWHCEHNAGDLSIDWSEGSARYNFVEPFTGAASGCPASRSIPTLPCAETQIIETLLDEIDELDDLETLASEDAEDDPLYDRDVFLDGEVVKIIGVMKSRITHNQYYYRFCNGKGNLEYIAAASLACLQ